MNSNRITLLTVILGLLSGVLQAQQPPPADPGNVIKTETKLVLVDAVVTDKKGAYVRDLTAKDFKVLEDKQEQNVKTFSFEADPNSPTASQKRYLVLFFDNSSMSFGDQAQARKAAAKFIESNAGPNRLMAIVNFGGSLVITQNFTNDVDRLKAVVSGVKSSWTTTAADNSGPMANLNRAAADFGTRDMILGLRTLAKNLADVPGRKTLILLTAGFPINDEQRYEVTAAIDACSKANVAIYPIDVRGLVAGGPTGKLETPNKAGFSSLLHRAASLSSSLGSLFQPVAYDPGAMGFFGQARPGGGGGAPAPGGGGGGGGAGGGRPGGGGGGAGGGGRGGSGSGGSGGAGGGKGGSPGTGGKGGTPAGNTGGRGGGGNITPGGANPALNPNANPRMILPKLPESSTTNQAVMFMLADGTGGFVIHDTNDLAGGLDRIGKELNEHYVLGYTPDESEEGSCHSLTVKVDRGGTTVRARSGYCNVKPRDILAGNPIEKTLEARALSSQAGNTTAALQVPFFYTGTNTARVNVAMEIPAGAFKFTKEKGKFRSEVNVLGIAAKADGTVGARFSETLKFEFPGKKEMEAFEETPYHYENQFDVASGQYNLKVVFSSASDSVGKTEIPLVVEAYDSKQFGLSGIAFSKQIMRADASANLDTDLISDHKPLIAQGLQIIPNGSNKFKASDTPALYFEVYEPQLADTENKNPVQVGIEMKVLERKTGAQKFDTGLIRVPIPDKSTNPVLPVGMKLPLTGLAPGAYTVELSALDKPGKPVVHRADFDIE